MIQSLQFEIAQLNDEVTQFKSINRNLQKMIREQQMGTPVLSPEDSDVSYSSCVHGPQFMC